MARLCGYLDLTPEAPGFLTPVFQPHAGANHLVTQIIDEEDRIIGFQEISPPDASIRPDWSDGSVEIGDHALWLFRLPNNAEALGPAYEISPTLAAWLFEGALEGWPLIAMEVAGFCGGAKLQSSHVQAGYESLRRSSEVTADIWLTTQVFLPAARRDLARALAIVGVPLPRDIDVEVVEDRIEVRTTATIPPGPTFSELRTVAEAMGLHEIALMVRHNEPKLVDFPLHTRVVGLGGVGRHVIRKKLNLPCHPLPPHLPSGAIGVTDSSHMQRLEGLFIGILQGDTRHLPAITTLADEHARPGSIRHLIQVRPFGYYPLQTRRSSIEEAADSPVNADVVWIVSQHRRERPIVEHRLTAADHASRTVALLVDLIIAIGDEWLHYVRKRDRLYPFFALAGATRFSRNEAFDQLLRRAVHDLLSEDFALASAKTIQIFLPRDWKDIGVRKVRLGPQTYRVELLPHPDGHRRKPIASLALDVSRSHDHHDYAAFCHGLLAAYGWDFGELVEDDDPVRILTLAQTRLSVRCFLYAHDLRMALSVGDAVTYDLLICMERISEHEREDAHADGMTAIHHSDLARWHWHELGIEAFGGPDRHNSDDYF